MKTCDNCAGEGGWEVAVMPASRWADPTPGGEWVRCPDCRGAGWVEGEPELLGIDDLDERCGGGDADG